MSKVYVFSTLANDQLYQNYSVNVGNEPVKNTAVFIKGGTGVATKNFITPLGVPTEITSEELEYLEKNPSFEKHKKDGFIIVQTKKAPAEKVAADMARNDKSAPLTPSDYIDKDVEVVLNKDL